MNAMVNSIHKMSKPSNDALPIAENKNPHRKLDGDVACIFLLDKG
jgi:hypothetical protein